MNNPNQREKNIFDDPRLRLYTERNKETNKSGSIQVLYFNDKVRLRAYHPDKSEPLELAFPSPVDALQFLEYMKNVGDMEHKSMRQFDVDGFNGKTGEKMVAGKIIIGRTEDGTCYLGMNRYGWDKPVVCKFQQTFRIKLVDSQGNPVSDARISANKMRAWASLVAELVRGFFVSTWSYPQPKNKQNNNNTNTNNTNNQPSSSSLDFDDDFVF